MPKYNARREEDEWHQALGEAWGQKTLHTKKILNFKSSPLQSFIWAFLYCNN